MRARTTTSAATGRRRPPAGIRRPGLYLGIAAAGAVLVNVVVGVGPAAQADPVASQPVSVAEQLGPAAGSSADGTEDLRPLEELAASRATREAEQTAAQQAQAAADQAVLDQQAAEAEAARVAAEAAAAAEAEAARVAAEAAAAAEAEAKAAAAKPAAPAQGGADAKPSAGVRANASAAVAAVARISNSAGAVEPQVQAAADGVVSNVSGAGSITIGGTRPSATDPNGHPSGRALDYMVLSDTAMGDAIVAHHIANWAELGVEYLIYQQRMLSSPGGSWKPMEDRGSVTENHLDHVHVNYR